MLIKKAESRLPAKLCGTKRQFEQLKIIIYIKTKNNKQRLTLTKILIYRRRKQSAFG